MLRGSAHFLDAHNITLNSAEESRTLSFDLAIIAAGSEPVRLPFLPQDDPRIVDSTGALALTSIPRRFMIIGAGVIGLEMATIYAALRSQVTVVEWMSQIIPGVDADLVAPLQKRMASRGIRFLLQTKLTRVGRAPRGVGRPLRRARCPAT